MFQSLINLNLKEQVAMDKVEKQHIHSSAEPDREQTMKGLVGKDKVNISRPPKGSSAKRYEADTSGSEHAVRKRRPQAAREL